MKRAFAHWSARLDGLSLRERALVFGAALMVLFLAWDQLLLAPLEARQVRTGQELDGLRTQTEQIRAQIETLAANGRGGRVGELDGRLLRLQEEHRRLDRRLEAATTGLIAPEAMARVLEEVLSTQDGLALLRVENQGARPLFADSEAAAQARVAGLYRHGLVLEFEGGYADTLRYLHALEALPHTFFWESVEFDVERHPRARVRLTVFTLSLEEGWIGV